MQSITKKEKLCLKINFEKEEILSVEVNSGSVEERKIEPASPEERDTLAVPTPCPCQVASEYSFRWFLFNTSHFHLVPFAGSDKTRQDKLTNETRDCSRAFIELIHGLMAKNRKR